LHRTLGDHPESRFAHNDYLGLRRNPEVVAGLIADLQEGLPTTGSGSRLLSGNLPTFQAFEREFSTRAGMPAALLFASASEANRVVLEVLVDRHGVVFHDDLAHASLIDGILHSGAKRRKFRHNDPEDLRRQLRADSSATRLVVTESVFSMDGDVAPLSDLLEVCKSEGALLLVDEAHSVGLFGPHRTGLCEELPRSEHLAATTHGFGKALASSGGILCTHPDVIEKIVNTSRAFIFTTAPSPLALRAAEGNWRISQRDLGRREKLDQLCNLLGQGLQERGWELPPRTRPTPIFPLHTKGLERANALSLHLAQQEIFLRPIRSPTVPVGSERLRATVSAELSPDHILAFLEILGNV
jgi:8-amino-7-oxononanoate synthase